MVARKESKFVSQTKVLSYKCVSEEVPYASCAILKRATIKSTHAKPPTMAP